MPVRRAFATLPTMFHADPFDVYSVPTGTLRLDGGAMFGVVPKVLWSKSSPADELNRIALATRSLVAVDRKDGRIIVADTGCGPKWSAADAARYAVSFDPGPLDQLLASLGVDRDSVTDVIVTHLHFDHNGGLTEWEDDPDGPTRLRFPEARHWVHRKHWDHAHNPHVKDRASFFPHDFAALANSPMLQLVEGDEPPGPARGWTWLLSHGHTPYHLHVRFGVDQQVVFVGDMVPTIAHLRPAWVMAYDMQPTRTIDEKQKLLADAIARRTVLAFAHDPIHAAVRIDGVVDRPIVSEIVDLAT